MSSLRRLVESRDRLLNLMTATSTQELALNSKQSNSLVPASFVADPATILLNDPDQRTSLFQLLPPVLPRLAVVKVIQLLEKKSLVELELAVLKKSLMGRKIVK